MPCLLSSKLTPLFILALSDRLYRYEIEGGAPGWADAEKQVLDAAKKGLKTNVVSVKSSKSKRKAGETAAEIYEQELGEKVHKRAKNGSKRG